MSADAILLRYMAPELAALGAFALPLPPRIPSFGEPRTLYTPPATPAVDATVAPKRAA